MGRGRNAAASGEIEEAFQFQCKEAESAWLRDAFTGRLKDSFSWKDHSEELQQECGGKLVLTDMGNQLVLIQSAMNEKTEKAINCFDEWTSFWMDWCKPWTFTDVSQQRFVRSRWIGVPLHAWSMRLFCLCSAKFGRLEKLHEVTRIRSRLDEAYVKVSTGLAWIDRIIKCKIDGTSFQIKVEEIRCMDNISHLKVLEDSESEEGFVSSAKSDWSSNDSVQAMDLHSDTDDKVQESVQGGLAGCYSPQPKGRLAAMGNERTARCNNEGKPIQIVAGSEKETAGSPSSASRPTQCRPNNLADWASYNSNGPTGNLLDTRFSESKSQPLSESSPRCCGPAGQSACAADLENFPVSKTRPTTTSLNLSHNHVHPEPSGRSISP